MEKHKEPSDENVKTEQVEPDETDDVEAHKKRLTEDALSDDDRDDFEAHKRR